MGKASRRKSQKRSAKPHLINKSLKGDTVLVVKGSAFENVTVELDGRRFEQCTISNCRMIYRGGPSPSFNECVITHNTFKFLDAAGRTLATLAAMSASGFNELVTELLHPILRAGTDQQAPSVQ